MEITKAKINKIQNIKLIYFYSTESFFTDDNNKYIGAKVVYGKAEKINIDYRSKYFEYFIRKIREVYNREKQTGRITLLGSLTKAVLEYSIFKESDDDNQNKSEKQISHFMVINKPITKYIDFLKETMKFVISLYTDSLDITIDEIKGYNKRFLLEYTVDNSSESVPMVVYMSDDELCFRTNRISDKNFVVYGKICEKSGEIVAGFENERISGSIRFVPMQNKAIREASDICGLIYYDEIEYEIDTEEIDIYFNAIGLDKPENGLKIGDTYVLCQKDFIEGGEEALYSYLMYIITVNQDTVINRIEKSEINRYQGAIVTSLEDRREEYSFSKINVEGNDYILLQRKIFDNDMVKYYYTVFEAVGGFSFDLENVSTQDDIKKKIIERRKNSGCI